MDLSQSTDESILRSFKNCSDRSKHKASYAFEMLKRGMYEELEPKDAYKAIDLALRLDPENIPSHILAAGIKMIDAGDVKDTKGIRESIENALNSRAAKIAAYNRRLKKAIKRKRVEIIQGKVVKRELKTKGPRHTKPKRRR